MDEERILIVEPESKVAELAVIKLSNAGYLVVTAGDGEEAYAKILNNPPDLLIINPNLAKKDGYELCAEVHTNERTSHIPIIILADHNFKEDFFSSLGLPLYEVLTKPFSPKMLLNKVNSLIFKAEMAKKINPLTGIPGKQDLEEDLNLIIKEEQKFGLIFCDLKDFRIYNKIYGFEGGNAVIKFMLKLLQEEIAGFNQAEPRLYHLGGDDFCILLKSGSAENMPQKIIERFDLEIFNFYNDNDRSRGGLVVTNRRGIVEQWPIMTLALALVGNERRKINSWLEAEAIGAELLRYAKSMPGSHFVKDRRSS